MAIIEVEHSFRVDGIRVDFAVKQLLKQIFLFHYVIDIFERLNYSLKNRKLQLQIRLL